MMDTTTRALDTGGPNFLLPQHGHLAALATCGHGVCVETPFDIATTADQIVLSLRRAEWHESGPAEVELERVFVTFSLSTGSCSPRDASAIRFLGEHGWFAQSLRSQENWLRERARRLVAQRDRTSCFAAFAGVRPGDMVPHDRLFPADWDLVFTHEGCTYWAVEHHCTNPACTCREVVVMLYEVDSPRTQHLGELRIDFAKSRLEPKASHARAAKLFGPLWEKHGAELLMRYGEVRRAVEAYATSRAAPATTDRAPRPARNAPCPCGSGKKYKRCCAEERGAGAASTPSGASRLAR
jgi:SEC-C motif-containing protein